MMALIVVAGIELGLANFMLWRAWGHWKASTEQLKETAKLVELAKKFHSDAMVQGVLLAGEALRDEFGIKRTIN